jgi:Holliday junction resolvase
MPHPSKRKGNRFERELRKAFREAGLRAERAYASNGESLATDGGDRCGEEVDLLVEGGLKVQAKRRASVAQYLSPPDGAHLTIVREDRADALAVLPLPLLVRLLRSVYD